MECGAHLRLRKPVFSVGRFRETPGRMLPARYARRFTEATSPLKQTVFTVSQTYDSSASAARKHRAGRLLRRRSCGRGRGRDGGRCGRLCRRLPGGGRFGRERAFRRRWRRRQRLVFVIDPINVVILGNVVAGVPGASAQKGGGAKDDQHAVGKIFHTGFLDWGWLCPFRSKKST